MSRFKFVQLVVFDCMINFALALNMLFAEEVPLDPVAAKLEAVEKVVQETKESQEKIIENQKAIDAELASLRVWINMRR